MPWPLSLAINCSRVADDRTECCVTGKTTSSSSRATHFSAQGHTWACSNLQTQPKTQTFSPHPNAPLSIFITGKGIISAVHYELRFSVSSLFTSPSLEVHIFRWCLYEKTHTASAYRSVALTILTLFLRTFTTDHYCYSKRKIATPYISELPI